MTLRSPVFPPALVFAGLLVATPAAAATPQLSGTYSLTGTETCQAVVEGGLASLGGRIEQMLGTLTLKPTTSGAAGRMITRGYGGRLLDHDRSVYRDMHAADATLTVTPRNGYYDLVLVQTFTARTQKTLGMIQFEQVVGGIAERAAIVGEHPNPDAAHSDCVVQYLLQRP